jgi:hypothetical protein
MTAILDAAITAIFGGLLCFCATTLHEIASLLKSIRDDVQRQSSGEQGS